MKKILLSAVAIAATVMTGWADEYTFVLDGENDLGGLTRQTSTKEADLTFSKSFTLTEEGVELKAEDKSENGLGFALINAGGTNAGLCAFSSFSKAMTPEITVSVPNGKVNSVKMYMSGNALAALDLTINGTAVSSENEGSLYYWAWNNSEGADAVTLTWTNSYYLRYIHSIQVTYTPDLGGKQACGLSFGAKEYETVIGEDFSAPVLTNPNNLAITWTSSDEAVAKVDAEGKLTIAGRGTTTITAATAGNDEYAAGNAKYALTVIPMAKNIAQLLEFAPAVYDRVKVGFPATVMFGNASVAFVVDAEGNAACFDDIRNRNSTSASTTTLYKAGDVIPAGWMATNATIYESVIWEGIPDKVTETVEVTYAEVSSVTPADVDKVVILKDVKFEKTTPDGNTKGYGTTPDGTSYEFQNIYNTETVAAGTYNVTCVVRYSKRGTTEYFFLAPIAYSEATGGDVEAPKFPESFDVKVTPEGLDMTQGIDPIFESYEISIIGLTDETEVTVELGVPEGWDGFIGTTDQESDPDINPLNTRADDEDEYWIPAEYLEAAGYKPGNKLTFQIDGEEHSGMMVLVKDGMAYLEQISIFLNVVPLSNSVDAIEAAGNVRYYDLQGKEISKPGKGMYIKVEGKKAVKAMIND